MKPIDWYIKLCCNCNMMVYLEGVQVNIVEGTVGRVSHLVGHDSGCDWDCDCDAWQGLVVPHAGLRPGLLLVPVPVRPWWPWSGLVPLLWPVPWFGLCPVPRSAVPTRPSPVSVSLSSRPLTLSRSPLSHFMATVQTRSSCTLFIFFFVLRFFVVLCEENLIKWLEKIVWLNFLTNGDNGCA